jgi:hypothetical protein
MLKHWIDGIAVVGGLGTFYFGFRSLLQSADLGVARAISQACFNQLWFIGDQMDKLLKPDVGHDGIVTHASNANGASHAARQMVINLSREHLGFTPSYEPAWEPKLQLPHVKKSWLRRFFRL